MNEMMLHPDEMRAAAAEFDNARKDLSIITKRLDETTAELKSKWEGAAQQIFYKEYAALRQEMGGIDLLINQISIEMKAIAERFEKADR